MNTLENIIEQIKVEYPDARLFQITVPDREDEIFIARKCAWGEYKKMIGKVKGEAEANELIVQKFLVHPKVDYETLNLEWEPGLVVTLATQIQKGLGFALEGAGLKNL
jgi:hypothetical protein